jgi:hypothetical protein
MPRGPRAGPRKARRNLVRPAEDDGAAEDHPQVDQHRADEQTVLEPHTGAKIVEQPVLFAQEIDAVRPGGEVPTPTTCEPTISSSATAIIV